MYKLGMSIFGKKLHMFDINNKYGFARCLCNNKFYDEHEYTIDFNNDIYLHNSNYCKKCNKIEVKEE